MVAGLGLAGVNRGLIGFQFDEQCRESTCRGVGISGECPGGAGVVEAEVDESSEVDGGESEAELCVVGLDSSISEPSVVFAYEPCD